MFAQKKEQISAITFPKFLSLRESSNQMWANLSPGATLSLNITNDGRQFFVKVSYLFRR
jgi:hypothetical protein